MSAMAITWQGSLFGDGPVAGDPSFSRLVRHQLDPWSWADHAPGWLSGSDDLLYDLLAAGAWQQRQRWMYEAKVDEPRLTAGWSVDDAACPAAVRDVAALLSHRYAVEFNSVWMNLYRDGTDSVAWHGDSNRKTVLNPLVVTLSLGAARRFQLRPRGGRIGRQFRLGHGDLLVMGGACQHDWEHCVPKAADTGGARMSVTLRHSQPLPAGWLPPRHG